MVKNTEPMANTIKSDMAFDARELDLDELDAATGGAGFLRLEGIEGESTDSGHKEWIIFQSMSAPIFS